MPTLHKTPDNARPKVYFPSEYTTLSLLSELTAPLAPRALTKVKVRYLPRVWSKLNPLSCHPDRSVSCIQFSSCCLESQPCPCRIKQTTLQKQQFFTQFSIQKSVQKSIKNHHGTNCIAALGDQFSSTSYWLLQLLQCNDIQYDTLISLAI